MSELLPYLESVAQEIDLMIDRYFIDKVGELNKASAHLLAAGGKRLRPAVVMLAADAVKRGSSQDIIQAALALELTHTFTLIHDDIMDDDSLRRGVQTVHTKWDMPTGILAGTFCMPGLLSSSAWQRRMTMQKFVQCPCLPVPAPISAKDSIWTCPLFTGMMSTSMNISKW